MNIKKITREKLGELYQFRYMFTALVKKSLAGRYKSSALGFLWNFITPAISVILFYVVFENFMGKDVPHYWAYLCIGMFSFTFLNENIIRGSTAITSNGSMIKKISFPLEIVVLAQVTYSFIVFVISYGIILFLMLSTGISMNVGSMIALLPITVTMFLFSLGSTFLLSSLTTYARDLQHLITAFARLLFWVTPIFYTTASLSGALSTIVHLNPLTYFVESYHNILYYGNLPTTSQFIITTILGVFMLMVGTIAFYRLKDGFAERV